jgi:hypothetical protein
MSLLAPAQPNEAPSPAAAQAFPLVAFIALAIIYPLYDALSYYAPPSISAAFALLNAATILLVALASIRWGVAYFIVSLVFADEISRYLWDYGGDAGVVSFLTFSVGGVAISNLVAVGLAAIALMAGLLRWADQPRRIRLNIADYAVGGIALIYALGMVHGAGSVLGNPRLAINHLNLPIMACAFYFIVRSAFSSREDAEWLLKVFLIAIGVKVSGWMALAILGVGSWFGTTLRVGFGAGWTTYVLLLLYGISLQQTRVRARLAERILAFACAVEAGLLLLMSAGRMLWVMTAFGLFVVWLFSRMRAKVYMTAAGALCMAGVFITLTAINPDMFITIRSMAGTLRFWEVENLESSPSTIVRIYELRNIHAQLADGNNLLLGQGPGSTFTDAYHPFPFGLSEGDFSIAEQQTRQFRNPHTLFAALLLHVGYLGMIGYLVCLGMLYWANYSALRNAATPLLRVMALSMFGYLPAMAYMTWNSKANMLFGLSIGMVGVLYAASVEAREPEDNAAPEAKDRPSELVPT